MRIFFTFVKLISKIGGRFLICFVSGMSKGA